MKFFGRVWKYGDNVNTDLLYPGRYTYTVRDEQEMGVHALEDLDPAFSKNVAAGDIVVGGRNWGCGSSRQQAVTCLKVRGVAAIIVKSVARIFYRNAINEALPVILCPQAVEATKMGEKIGVDFAEGLIETPRGTFAFSPLPPILRRIFEAGGLVAYVNAKLKCHSSAG